MNRGWDFDGVIVDSLGDFHNWLKYIYEHQEVRSPAILHRRAQGNFKLPWRTLNDVRQHYREPIVPSVYEALGFDMIYDFELIQTEFEKRDTDSGLLFYKAIETVLKCKQEFGGNDYIISNSTTTRLRKHFKMLNLYKIFQTAFGRDILPLDDQGKFRTKPDPISLIFAKRYFGIEVYIGDQNIDIQAAKSAGLPILVHSNGYELKSNLTGYDAMFDCLTEVPELLKKMF